MARRAGTGQYPPEWPAIARRVKDAAGWRCVRCGHPHDVAARRVLTVHHLDGQKDNCVWWNLLALCQVCHLSVQGRVDLRRPWVMAPHSEWFRVYAAGWYAHRYQGLDLTRAEVMARLPELLELEQRAVLGTHP